MKRILLLTGLIASSLSISTAEQAFVNRIPNGAQFSCANCHINPAGDGPRNVFGTAFGNNNKRWSSTLAKLDSDNDGFTNGQELQDPNGTWTTGSAQPGNVELVTNPSDPSDFPSSVEEVIALNNFTISPIPASNFINFSIKTGIIGNLTVSIFDINGLLVNSFSSVNSNGEYNFGWNLMTFNSIPVESGFYFAEVKMNNFVERRRFVVAR